MERLETRWMWIIPPIAVIGEAGPSGLQAGQFQPPAKKRHIQDAYEVEDDGQKSYNISSREIKSLKVILYVALKKSRVLDFTWNIKQNGIQNL